MNERRFGWHEWSWIHIDMALLAQFSLLHAVQLNRLDLHTRVSLFEFCIRAHVLTL